MQLIDPIDIFEDNYNIVRDRFETDSVNVMKNKPVVAKKQRKSQYTGFPKYYVFMGGTVPPSERGP